MLKRQNSLKFLTNNIKRFDVNISSKFTINVYNGNDKKHVHNLNNSICVQITDPLFIHKNPTVETDHIKKLRIFKRMLLKMNYNV